MADNAISKLYVLIGASTAGLSAGLNKALADVTKWANDVSKVAVGNIIANNIGGAINGLASGFTGAIRHASDLNESISKTRALLGDNANEAIAFANQMEASGVASSKTVLDSFSNTFLALKNQGLSTQEAFSSAKALEERMADISSQSNLPAEQLREMVQSGLAGQFEALRGMSVYTSAEQLDQRGGGGGGSAAEKQKVRAKGIVQEILKQTASAKGDFEATKFSYANLERQGDVKSQGVSTRIGQDLLAVGQTFQYFRGRFLSVILQIANTGAFKKIGQMLSDAVGYIGMAFETILPALTGTVISWMERLVEGIKFMATIVMAVITKPQSVIDIISGMIQLAGIALADKINWVANKLSLGLIERTDNSNQKEAPQKKIDQGMQEIQDQKAKYDEAMKELYKKFEGAGQSGTPPGLQMPQTQANDTAKSTRSAFNSLLQDVVGGGKKYEDQMLTATKAIAENTKPKGTGVSDVAQGTPSRASQPQLAMGL